jgi:hypothetical protein
MRPCVLRFFGALLMVGASTHACAQILIEGRERLADDRPEAWAMNRAIAASLPTAFGDATPAPGRWRLAAELSQVPHLDSGQRRVGFDGNKPEDLNKSPAFGRLRLIAGLPSGWSAELAYTPPVRHRGARAEDLFAAAIGRRWTLATTTTLTLRAFGQHGRIVGDITCPARLAGVESFALNPYGCQAPSRDRVALNHYGLDLTAAVGDGAWRWHVGLGAVRVEPEVQVDALVYDARDRTRLIARDVLPFATAGVRRVLSERWSVAAEVLHVPMSRRVGPGDQHSHGPGEGHEDTRPVREDAYTGLRLQLAWH